MVKNTLLEEIHGNLLRVKVLDVVVMFTSSGSRVENITHKYRSGTVNSKSFVGKVLLRIKWKYELNYTL